MEELIATVPDAFVGDGVAFLQTVYKDPRNPMRLRIDAAAKAARFERSVMASNRVIRGVNDLTEQEMAAIAGEKMESER
jgi:hypothetical protein